MFGALLNLVSVEERGKARWVGQQEESRQGDTGSDGREFHVWQPPVPLWASVLALLTCLVVASESIESTWKFPQDSSLLVPSVPG